MALNLETFAIQTLGCKVNTYESQVIINDLLSNGLVQVDFDQKADIYIINTCTVTNIADSKSRNMISRANKLNPQAVIVVAGCYAQTSSDEIKEKLKVDILIGNKYKNNLLDLIKEYKKNQKQITKVDNLLLEKEFEETLTSSFEDRTRAFIKIQDGCNFMCSYCTIPFARGRQRSAKASNIISQVQDFVKRGFKEIVLTGVNTAGYDDGQTNFYQLLKKIHALPGNFRIRISSVEPFQITDEIVELITKNQDRFCNHWHLCIQSGSDAILEKMNRKYSCEQFKTLVNKIRTLSPTACISTDYIVGFPTETEQDHKTSLEFLKEIKMSSCHIFTYSKRRNTAAARLKDLNGTIKHNRFLEAEALNKQLYKEYLTQFINKEIEVIFEKYENGVYIGKSSEYSKVLVRTDKPNLLNQFIKVKVKQVFNNELICELL